MVKEERLIIRLSKEKKKRIEELAKAKSKSITKYIIDSCLCDQDQEVVRTNEIELTVFSIKFSEEPIKFEEKKLFPEGLSNKEQIIKEMQLKFFNNVSWETYILWILYHYSKDGIRLDEYIKEQLQYMKQFPKFEDLRKNFPVLHNTEFEIVYTYCSEKRVRDFIDFKKIISKIEELSLSQIKEFCKNNDSI